MVPLQNNSSSHITRYATYSQVTAKLFHLNSSATTHYDTALYFVCISIRYSLWIMLNQSTSSTSFLFRFNTLGSINKNSSVTRATVLISAPIIRSHTNTGIQDCYYMRSAEYIDIIKHRNLCQCVCVCMFLSIIMTQLYRAQKKRIYRLQLFRLCYVVAFGGCDYAAGKFLGALELAIAVPHVVALHIVACKCFLLSTKWALYYCITEYRVYANRPALSGIVCHCDLGRTRNTRMGEW